MFWNSKIGSNEATFLTIALALMILFAIVNVAVFPYAWVTCG